MTASDSLARLVAEREIEQLLFTYAFHLDMNQTSELAALFTEDCEVIYGPDGFGAQGRAAYAKTLEGVGTFFKATSHHVSNIVVTWVSEDEAQVRSVLYAWHRYQRDMPDSHVWGQYHDVIVRQGGKWMFKRRELRVAGEKDFHVKKTLDLGRR